MSHPYTILLQDLIRAQTPGGLFTPSPGMAAEVLRLVAGGAVVNEKDAGSLSPFMRCMTVSNPISYQGEAHLDRVLMAVLQIMIDNGADLQATVPDGRTAYLVACDWPMKDARLMMEDAMTRAAPGEMEARAAAEAARRKAEYEAFLRRIRPKSGAAPPRL